MKLQGIIELPLVFARTWIHFGQKDGQDFAQISYPDLGAMNSAVAEASITDSTADFLVDMSGFPMTIHLERKDDAWFSHVSLKSISMEQDFQGTLVSTDPSFQEKHYTVPEENLAILRRNSSYDTRDCEALLRYELHNPQVLAYLQEKGFTAVTGHTFSDARSIMGQVSKRVFQDGLNYSHDKTHRGTIAQLTFAGEHENKTNCRGISIILCGVLRAYGFCANYVECWPKPSPYQEIHVVCEVYCEDLKKSVLLDPSSNLIYFLDGVPLSAVELRKALCDGRAGDITINEDAIHGTDPVNKSEMLAYMSKNLVVLAKCLRSNEREEMADGNCIALVPLGMQDDRFQIRGGVCTHSLQEFYKAKP